MKNVFWLTLIAFTLVATTNIAQDVLGKSDGYNIITTAVPFLTISPDARSSSLGDAGVATSPDVWSMHWNPAKYATAEESFAVGLSRTPWLRNLGISDLSLISLAAYYKLGEKHAVALSHKRFLGVGDFSYTDDNGDEIPTTFSPSEWFTDIAYSRTITDHFSLALANRFIYSNLIGVIDPESKAGLSFAVDIAGYYRRDIPIFGEKSKLNLGFNISNIGTKISYTKSGEKDFIPTNLKLGGGFEAKFNKYNKLGAYFEFNKLLVPSEDSDSDLGVFPGMIKSFGDAPEGFSEEIHEITVSTGIEYFVYKFFSYRMGLFREHESKGDRNYFTTGIGLNIFGGELDVSYLIPADKYSPLAKTFRFTLVYQLIDYKNYLK